MELGRKRGMEISCYLKRVGQSSCYEVLESWWLKN
jgi:hypothetical protein